MERIFVFLRSPSAATSVLLGATVLALILANSPSSEQYFQIVNHHIGNLTILEWVNDALMAIFFLFVGLEVKREFVAGELNTNAKRVMPGIAALFGVLTPAFIYYLIAGFDLEIIKKEKNKDDKSESKSEEPPRDYSEGSSGLLKTDKENQ